MAELSPAASSHDRGYDSPQSFCDDPTTLHPRRFQVQPIFDHFPDCLRLQATLLCLKLSHPSDHRGAHGYAL